MFKLEVEKHIKKFTQAILIKKDLESLGNFFRGFQASAIISLFVNGFLIILLSKTYSV